MFFLYHPISASSFKFESLEPHGKGTLIFFSKLVFELNHLFEIPISFESNLNSQVPFKLIHCGLLKSGLGCSGKGVCAATKLIPNIIIKKFFIV